MLLRVRTHLGVWKVEVPDDATAADLKRVLVQKYNPEGGLPQPLTRDPRWQEALDDDAPLAAGGVAHGDMIYLRLEEGQVGSHEESKTARTITKDGQIVMQQFSSVSERNGFRPGMLPLSAMKKHWTLQEFVDLDNQFVFQMKRQEEATCKGASVDQTSLNSFQTFMRRLDFRRLRVGMLYGTYTEDGKVQAECIYEPPQEADDKHFTFLDDPQQERVDALAAMLSLQKVGWIFAHPPREEGFFFSGNEVLTAAELQLEAAGGVEETPFVTVKVTLNAEGETQVEAYQVSQLAMRMVAEEALQLHAEKLDNLRVNSTFTVTQEGRVGRAFGAAGRGAFDSRPRRRRRARWSPRSSCATSPSSPSRAPSSAPSSPSPTEMTRLKRWTP